jgi:hypothetical protein
MSMNELQVNTRLLETFEQGLDPQHPERGKIPARVLGYGEISTVFEIQVDELRGLAFKRLPLFYTASEVDRYCAVYEEYHRLLTDEVSLRLPSHGHVTLVGASGRPVFYIIQRQLEYASIGHHALHILPREGVTVLVTRILRELRRVWDYSRRQSRVQIGIDGQISNWAIDGFATDHPHLDEDTRLFYVDTSTPLIRVNGVEQLDAELFLRSAPSFLVWVLRLFFLKDVVNRYYDLRLVAIDLVANFYKEQQPALVPDAIGAVNRFFANEAADLGLQPIDEPTVRSYYREDAFIWSLYLNMRKVDRFIRRRLLRREYPYILPEQIKR